MDNSFSPSSLKMEVRLQSTILLIKQTFISPLLCIRQGWFPGNSPSTLGITSKSTFEINPVLNYNQRSSNFMSEVMPLLPWREYYYIVDLVYPEESAPEKGLLGRRSQTLKQDDLKGASEQYPLPTDIGSVKSKICLNFY